jgi:hypothetical protein
VEQALYVLRILTEGYGSDTTVTPLVDAREVFIIFAVNPDGGEFDLTGDPNGPRGPYRAWRKNRQPNAGSSNVGTDLNRNYDYRWGCCGGSSGSTGSSTYRGSGPFSAPETRVFRDFVKSRVIGGIQQIRSHITFHTNGELILWPYGYTRTDVPKDMTPVDHDALVTFAKRQASRNGYHAEQSSDLYITDGDQIDWMFGRYRIFSYTWELYPPETATIWGDHYPADEKIASQTARNRDALLYFIANGWCPYTVLGATIRDRLCGPFNDDFEVVRGWKANPLGTDTANRGGWERGSPVAISIGGQPRQLKMTNGRYGLVTGAALNGSASANDLDAGTSTVRSVPIALPADPGDLTFRWFLGTTTGSSTSDALRAYIEKSDGSRTEVFDVRGRTSGRVAVWATARINLDAWAGQSIRIVFSATDKGGPSHVDAGIDEVRVEKVS